ncbi:TadE/TadG family type IV pilus assembly protein [Sphingomonas sp. KC8]|uniref:TadE/TadG family type IV pilus assembly protein n=1 Tax=Sphingomonas sp. KC8 TaxID=1030157 RepID=UPI0004972277|nr:TadE family protein [Sphingomonas sp. KC8]ARS28812.1 hypothetical protein KC8_16160 [Sphingomonas sp. KC8]
MPKKSLRQDISGIAMVEFALCIPPVLLLGLTGIETANFVMANLRISQIAMTTADNAARVRDSIDEYDINELFIGAKQVGAAARFADHGRVILSSVEPRTVAPLTTSVGGKDVPNQWIRWQRCYGMKNVASTYGAPRTAGNAIIADGTEASSTPSDQIKSVPKVGVLDTPTGIGPTANQIGAVSGTAVMFVEVFYDYQPIVWTSLLRNHTIRYTSAFNVRQRKDQVMKTAGLAANTWSTCNRYYT